MKAVVLRDFGDVDVRKYDDVAAPTPRPGRVLIKELAAGVRIRVVTGGERE